MYEDFNMDQLSVEIMKLTDQVRDIKKKLRETPIYKIITRMKLSKELKDANKKTTEIGKRMMDIERSPIQIISRK